MNASSDTQLSKGMKMVAAYRAARFSQRPELRSSLHDSHTARRMARNGQRAEPEQQAPLEAAPPPCVASAGTSTPEPGSVFASLVSISVATIPDAELAEPEATRSEGDRVVEDEDMEARPIPQLSCEDAAEAASPAGTADATPSPAPAYDPPLAEIGFGPGMLIRLSQLGLHTTADLACADAEQLRSDLGDISRLVDVEAWITNARQTVCTMSN